MAWAMKLGPTVLLIKDNTLKAKSMAKALSAGPMVALMTETFTTIILKASAFIIGAI